MKLIALTLLSLALLTAAEPARVPFKYAAPPATVVIDFPIGIWPLCLAGIAMPGCYAGMPEVWVRYVYVLLPDGSLGALLGTTTLARLNVQR